MKKFVNDPRQFVPEMLEGHRSSPAAARSSTSPKYNLIYRADMPRDDKVSIIQGSGSGHEPAHTMIVGPGMLDGACPGDVFAGPPSEFVYETSKLLDSPKGILHIVNNYTGDRTAWEMGKELCEAEGMKIGDAARQRRRRGQGLDLDGRPARRGRQLLRDQGGRRPRPRRARSSTSCVEIGEKVIASTRTMGIALTSCTPPARARRSSRSATTRWRSASASTASRAASGRSSPRRTRSSTSCSTRSCPTCRFERRRGRADGQRPRRHADQRALPALRHRPQEARRARASRSSAATSTSTAPRSRWPARSLTLLKVDDELKELLAAPAEVGGADLLIGFTASRFPAARGKRSAASVAGARVAGAGPRREHEQQPRVLGRADLVTLARVEHEQLARTGCDGVAGLDLDMA